MKKTAIISFYLWLLHGFVFAQSLADSTLKSVHRFDRIEFNKLKESKEFQYKELGEQDLSWIERLIAWIIELLNKILPKNLPIPQSGVSFNWLYWILCFVLAGIIIYLIFRANFSSIFSKKAKKIQNNEFEILEENIHEIKFVDEITLAENDGNYRKAIRLRYLKILKSLHDHGLIEWNPSITNTQLKRKLKNTPYSKEFNDIVYIYEYTWYGLFNPSLDEYTKIKSILDQFSKKFNTVGE